MNDIAGAIDNCSLGLRIMQIALRTINQDIAQFHIDLAFVLQLNNQIPEALDNLYHARDILLAIYGPNHRKVQAVQSLIENAPEGPGQK